MWHSCYATQDKAKFHCFLTSHAYRPNRFSAYQKRKFTNNRVLINLQTDLRKSVLRWFNKLKIIMSRWRRTPSILEGCPKYLVYASFRCWTIWSESGTLELEVWDKTGCWYHEISLPAAHAAAQCKRDAKVHIFFVVNLKKIVKLDFSLHRTLWCHSIVY